MKLKKSKKAKTPRSPRSPKEPKEGEGASPVPEEEAREPSDMIPGPLGVEDLNIPLLKIAKVDETGPRMVSMVLKDKQVVNMMFSSSKTMDQWEEDVRKHAFPGASDEVFAFRCA